MSLRLSNGARQGRSPCLNLQLHHPVTGIKRDNNAPGALEIDHATVVPCGLSLPLEAYTISAISQILGKNPPVFSNFPYIFPYINLDLCR